MKGFTLMELLIALVLASLLAVLMFGGLRVATQSWDKAGDQGDRIQEATLTQQFLRQLLAGISDEPLEDQAGNSLMGLKGDDGQLLFLAELPRQLGGDGGQLAWYRLAMVDGDDGPRLSLQVMTGAAQEGELDEQYIEDWQTLEALLQEDGDSHQLADDRVLGIQLGYYRVEEGQGDWVRAWEESNRLPALIRFHFTVTDGQQRFWPDLVIQPRIQAYAIREAF
ncbi:prepilin-type N-terminal cleavage/methylation domain-containing protein [Gallaecimonas sp. GXIMD4217]|uniref:prepilin-type N-terminal cleavage/methylation domain-containing protein n=1 Tax=Gallaecimonas sp. GXIMD4217 TaxID=3131927 RepID=UPI00311B144A